MRFHTTAVLENGHLTPVVPLQGLAEHSVVSLTIEDLPPHTRDEQLEMLRAVPVAEDLANAIEKGRQQTWTAPEY